VVGVVIAGAGFYLMLVGVIAAGVEMGNKELVALSGKQCRRHMF
jgi:hypothetical protein